MNQRHHHHHHRRHEPCYGADPDTTFVQADPASFRTIVQKLTGATPESSSTAQKVPLAAKKGEFRLHERRQSAKKLELKLHDIADNPNSGSKNDPFDLFRQQHQQRGFLVSPVSHLDHYWGRVSPSSTREESHAPDDDEEKRAIAEKGFYLHRSPLSTPREAEPELLPLFPLHSPTDNQSH